MIDGTTAALTLREWGDFDGDMDEGDGADDAVFDAAFCTEFGVDGNYNRLVDYDCDGDVDCNDFDEYDKLGSPTSSACSVGSCS